MIKGFSNFYKAVVRLIMTCGAETRAATTKTKQLLRTTEMNTLRAILGKTGFDRMKNIDILERCSLQEVVKFVKSRRKALNEHVSRAEQRLIRLVRDARPNTKRPPGRPPKRWADSWQSSFTGTPQIVRPRRRIGEYRLLDEEEIIFNKLNS